MIYVRTRKVIEMHRYDSQRSVLFGCGSRVHAGWPDRCGELV
jgi:hypothetical protein